MNKKMTIIAMMLISSSVSADDRNNTASCDSTCGSTIAYVSVKQKNSQSLTSQCEVGKIEEKTESCSNDINKSIVSKREILSCSLNDYNQINAEYSSWTKTGSCEPVLVATDMVLEWSIAPSSNDSNCSRQFVQKAYTYDVYDNNNKVLKSTSNLQYHCSFVNKKEIISCDMSKITTTYYTISSDKRSILMNNASTSSYVLEKNC